MAITTPLPTVTINGLEVTTLWFGGAPLGGLFSPVSEAQAHAAMQAAWDAGIRSYDVAPLYGNGLAERRVGAFLATKPRDAFTLCSKVGRVVADNAGQEGAEMAEPAFDYSPDAVRRSVESSLERMGLDRLDVALIHDPDFNFRPAMDEAYPTLEAMRSTGVVKVIGLGMNQTEMLERFVRDTDIDCVLVAGRYSLLDDRAAAGLLPAAVQRNVAVMAAGVFNSGILADPKPGAPFNYEPADVSLLERANAIRRITEAHGISLSRVALQWPLRHPAVTNVVVGMRSPEEVASNVSQFVAPVAASVWEELERSELLGW